MFWNKKDLTVLDVINRELVRLHQELASFQYGALDDYSEEYFKVLEEISKLNTQLIELSKKCVKNEEKL